MQAVKSQTPLAPPSSTASPRAAAGGEQAPSARARGDGFGLVDRLEGPSGATPRRELPDALVLQVGKALSELERRIVGEDGTGDFRPTTVNDNKTSVTLHRGGGGAWYSLSVPAEAVHITKPSFGHGLQKGEVWVTRSGLDGFAVRLKRDRGTVDFELEVNHRLVYHLEMGKGREHPESRALVDVVKGFRDRLLAYAAREEFNGIRRHGDY